MQSIREQLIFCLVVFAVKSGYLSVIFLKGSLNTTFTVYPSKRNLSTADIVFCALVVAEIAMQKRTKNMECFKIVNFNKDKSHIKVYTIMP